MFTEYHIQYASDVLLYTWTFTAVLVNNSTEPIIFVYIVEICVITIDKITRQLGIHKSVIRNIENPRQ